MAKMDKEYKIRMEGYVQALRFAKQYGLEELEKDVKRRGFYGIPVQISRKEVDKFMEQIAENLTNTVTAVMLRVLNEKLGFGKTRLKRFKKWFDDATDMVFKFDYMGGHYVTLEDYAVRLNEKYDLGLDVDRIAACQDSCRYEKENIRMVNVDVLIDRLHEYGYDDAADWMDRMVN